MGVTPGSTPPRFPGYDVVNQSATWDGTTSAVVLSRLRPSAEATTFFSRDEEPIARALVDRLLAQNDEPRVPVFEAIDRRLAEGIGDGYRYEDLPDDSEAWRRSLAALDADARTQFGQSFGDLPARSQAQLVEDVRLCKESWHGLPATRVFGLWMRYACSAFYAHPWAWNEIGFGGPAYPRGYKNLGLDRREPWEVAEHHAEDPIPWVERADAAKRRHAQRLQPGEPGEPGPDQSDDPNTDGNTPRPQDATNRS